MLITKFQMLRFDVENYEWNGFANRQKISAVAEELHDSIVLTLTRDFVEFIYRVDNPFSLPILKLLSLVSLDDYCTYSNYDEYDVKERKMVQAVVEKAIQYIAKREGDV